MQKIKSVVNAPNDGASNCLLRASFLRQWIRQLCAKVILFLVHLKGFLLSAMRNNQTTRLPHPVDR
jgi:hypothetical protein